MATAEVTVMGGGVIGLACAFVCARRGARVRLVERERIGAGASGGVVGALAPHVPGAWNAKKAFQLDSLLMAETFWADVAGLSGRDPLYARTGRLQALESDADVDLARARGAEAAALWQGRATWRVAPAAEFGNWAPATPTGLVVHDTLSARIAPVPALDALTGALADLGAEVVVGEAAPEGVVIWATGAAGLTDLSAALARDVGGAVKGQAALLAHRAQNAPQLFVDGLHIVPHGDGTVAVGSTSERRFDAPDTTDSQLDALLARARLACPALANAPLLARWAGLRPRARSRAPMLGEWPGRPGHYIANGGFKIGFGMAPKIAEAMADLILDGTDRIPEGFRVEDNI